jgi:alkanesulfonate monooxygenase SsuD/methylene tetrahydromethanopterin reductase-like flavin-dependent oxidoreductase (luciferase family)
MADVKLGAFLFGGVEMEDQGGPTNPMDRWYSNEQCWDATLKYIDAGIEADKLGYDSFWTTEHHFQYEGYEVIPNGLSISTWIAAKTTNVKLGAMFNVVPQWNPLKLAEDFATLHNLSKGRGLLGVGRGTVPREILHLNNDQISIGSADNPEAVADDARNREWFEEAMEVIKIALKEERFSHTGKFFQLPVPGIPDRGTTVTHLTLVPRPLYLYEVWQPVTSPGTLEYVPRAGHSAVFFNQHPTFIKRMWDRYGQLHDDTFGGTLAAADKRMLVVKVRIEDTHEQALASAKPGHDEFWKFLGPYGWGRGYMGPDGNPINQSITPTLEQSIENRTILVGTPEEVAQQVQEYRDLLGFDYLTIYPHLPGDKYAKAVEQMARFKQQVLPLVH